MPCFSPLKGYRSATRGANGKYGISFKPQGAFIDLPVEVACGQCLGCRMKRAQEWAIRCVQEAQGYKDNCFMTLTYRDTDIPYAGSLRPKDFTDFMKRLRKRISPTKIRFFQCGEYGENLGRPHHHCLIFGWKPDDLKLRRVDGDKRLYQSSLIDDLWGKGYVWIGDITVESASYCAKYIMKKVTGANADSHYNGRVPEYITMSRRPGIGRFWIDKYFPQVYKEDKVVYGLGKVAKPPRYYDKVFSAISPVHFEVISKKRTKAAVNNPDMSAARLSVRSRSASLRAKNTIRRMEVSTDGSI